MVRILFLITSSDFGGAETLLFQQVISLNKNEYEPLVCSLKTRGSIAKKLESLGVKTTSIDLDLRRDWIRPWRVLKTLRQLHQLIDSFRPDVIHASLFQADVIGSLLGYLSRVPVRIATVHMVLKKRIVELVIERLCSPFIDCYLAVSKDIRRFYKSRLFLPAHKIETISNAVDEEELERKAAQKPPAFQNFKPRYLVAVGRLDPQKDMKTLLDAFQRISQRFDDTGLVLVGDGPEREELEQIVEQWKLTNSVRFAGFQENPMSFIAASQALVLSSQEEGLPLVILEAMALGKPVISTIVGAVPEIVDNEQSGLLVPSRDPAALAQAIERVLSDNTLAAQMGAAGRLIVRKKYSIKTMREKLDRLYKTLLEKAKK